MDFVIGGVTAVVVICGYWALVALDEWVDLRAARRIRREAARQSKP